MHTYYVCDKSKIRQITKPPHRIKNMNTYLCNKCNAEDADSIPCKLVVNDPDIDPGFCPFTVRRNNATVADWALKKNRSLLSDLLYSIASFLFKIAK